MYWIAQGALFNTLQWPLWESSLKTVDMCLYNWLILLYTETNTLLQINYIQKRFF